MWSQNLVIATGTEAYQQPTERSLGPVGYKNVAGISATRSPVGDLPKSPAMGRLLRYQPFKGLYLAYVLLSTVFVRIPWWCTRYLLPQNRPRAPWSLWQAVLVRLHRTVLFQIVLDVGLQEPPPKVDGKLKDAKAVWIEGLADNSPAFCGEVRRAASINRVRPEKVLAFWLFKPGTGVPADFKAKEGEKVVIYTHSGGFVVSRASVVIFRVTRTHRICH